MVSVTAGVKENSCSGDIPNISSASSARETAKTGKTAKMAKMAKMKTAKNTIACEGGLEVTKQSVGGVKAESWLSEAKNSGGSYVSEVVVD